MGEIFLTFLRLGCTSFGGPAAHLGYFQDEFVRRRGWISNETYADLLALCQFLPGPASTQLGISIGHLRGGYPGAFLAWLGFTLPSALVLIGFALSVKSFSHPALEGALHGLKIVAVAVVAKAILAMGKKLCPDAPRIAMMVLSAVILLFWPDASAQFVVIGTGAALGCIFLPGGQSGVARPESPGSRRIGFAWLLCFGGLLLFLPPLAQSSVLAQNLEVFYRTGALVFGGGHVVLPLLEKSLVPHQISQDLFLGGYGAAQAVPGPLFTLAAYLGAVSSGFAGGVFCLMAIFLPSFLLIFGVMPFWQNLRGYPRVRQALSGVNASVVGLLVAAFYDPVFTGAISVPQDFALALMAFCALHFFRTPAWLTVLLCGAVGAFL